MNLRDILSGIGLPKKDLDRALEESRHVVSSVGDAAHAAEKVLEQLATRAKPGSKSQAACALASLGLMKVRENADAILRKKRDP